MPRVSAEGRGVEARAKPLRPLLERRAITRDDQFALTRFAAERHHRTPREEVLDEHGVRRERGRRIERSCIENER